MTHTKYNYTIGIDLGDKAHETCTINSQGEIVERRSLLNSREELLRFKGATIIMEATRKHLRPIQLTHKRSLLPEDDFRDCIPMSGPDDCVISVCIRAQPMPLRINMRTS